MYRATHSVRQRVPVDNVAPPVLQLDRLVDVAAAAVGGVEALVGSLVAVAVDDKLAVVEHL